MPVWLSLHKRVKEPQKYGNAKKTVQLTTKQTRSEIAMVFIQYSVRTCPISKFDDQVDSQHQLEFISPPVGLLHCTCMATRTYPVPASTCPAGF